MLLQKLDSGRIRFVAPSNPEIPLPGSPRRAFLGFFLIGGLMAIPGAALVAWDYHLQPPFLDICFHFLGFVLGILASLRLSSFLLNRFGPHRLLTAAMLCAAVAIVLVEFSTAPAARHCSLALTGFALGGIMAATVHLLQPLYERDPAATMNLAGGMLGLGALLTALLGALSYSWTEFEGLFIFLALLPFAASAWFFRKGLPPAHASTTLGFRQVWRDARSPVHVLFAALLFFETAAEVSVLEWVPLHLILRSGMSPSSAMYFLAFYCLSLLGSRFLAQALLVRFPHRRLLLASAALSWLGILFFGRATNAIGAMLGLAMSALGFAFVFPLLVERIGDRFREYHSNLFHGIFGLAMVGGYLAPALIAFWAWYSSSEASAMTVPLVCSLLVFVLLVILWIESRISASRVVRN